jgi:DNA-binding transcriptional LysR family regulator
MLNLVHVRAFVAVIEHGTFNDAARALGCAQPTVSQHVLKLEKAMDATLVVRDRQHCYPTPEGRQLMPFARSLLTLARQAKAAVREERILRVGASSNVGIYLLQPHVRSFRSSLGRNGHVDIWIGSNPEVAERLVAHEIDVAVTEWWDDRPGFPSTLWRRVSLVVIVPPEHTWSGQASIARDRLFATPLVGGESGSGTGRILREAFGADADRLQVNLRLGSTEAVKRAVRAGLGVSIVLESAVADELRAGTLCALTVDDVSLAKDIFVTRHNEGTTSAAIATRFVDHLVLARAS